MARTFKDIPYRIAKERRGIEDNFLRPSAPARRRHVFDAIFYSDEHSAIAEFETNLQSDERLDAEKIETKGHLVTGRPAQPRGSFFVPLKINDEPVESLVKLERREVGYSKPSGDLFERYTMARKSNVFTVFQVFRVSEAREATFIIDKYIPYWSSYFGPCRCDWCSDPRKADLSSREAHRLDDIAKSFNAGVSLEDLEDDLF